MIENHDLRHEFPEFADRIHQLKTSNPTFRKLFDDYHELDREIRRMEQDVEPTDDATLATYLATARLKKLAGATITDAKRLEAELARVREQGWSWVDGELDDSICGLAVPVRDPEGLVVASINISLPSGTHTMARAREKFLVPLRRAATRIRGAHA